MPAPDAPPRFGVLGPLEARRDGVVVDLGGPRQRHVLAVLLAARGRHVSTDRLLDEAWGEPPDAGRRTLAAHVSRLRIALGEDGGDLLRFESDGYVLRIPTSAVDAELFRERLLRARAAGRDASGDGLRLLDEALGLWRGTPYQDVSTVSSDAERRRLDELRAGALVDRAAARLQLGRPEEAVEDLVPLVEDDPLQERPVHLLATALDRCGRRAEALRLLARVRERMVEDYGLDPGPDLEGLERRLRSPAPTSVTPAAGPPPGEGHRADLPPRPLTRVIGREALLRDLPDPRLLVLVGPAGTGKTRLALEVAHARPDLRRGWVAVEGLADADLLEPAVAQALGVTVEPGRPAREGVVAALADREAILFLDNCESLRGAAADVAATLLAACPALRVVATSREPLGVPGERLVEVPPLPVETATGADGGAVELFLDRARDLQPGWEPDADDLAAIRRICRRLDGLPLAVELAAARTRTLDPGDIALALEARSDLLAAPGAGLAPHHRSLEHTLRWSYDLLEPHEQTHFRALAVFAGGFDLAGARALLGGGAVVGVAGMVRRSLLVVERRGTAWRYRMLAPLRSFALDVTDPGEGQEWSRRHLRWVVAFASEAAGQLRGPDAAAWLDRVELQRTDVRAAVRAALALGEHGTALAIGADLAWFWYRRGAAAEGMLLLGEALDAAPRDQPERGRALLGLSLLEYLQGEPTAGAAHAVEAGRLLGARGERRALVTAESTAAWLYAAMGDLPAARAHAERSLELARSDGAADAEAESLMVLGQICRSDRGPQEADGLLMRSVELARLSGQDWVAASSAWVAAKVALAAGDPEAALHRARPAVVQLAREGDQPALLAFAMVVAAALADLGRVRDGLRLATAAAEEGSRVGYDPARMDPVDSGWLRTAVFRSSDAAARREVREEVRAWGAPEVERALLDAVDAR